MLRDNNDILHQPLYGESDTIYFFQLWPLVRKISAVEFFDFLTKNAD